MGFDNVSSCPDWLSDALSTISTGGSYATRLLYSDDEETVFTANQPVVIAGIHNIVIKGDLLERMILLGLPKINKSARLAEDQFWREFNVVYPSIFGALCDAVSRALRNIDRIRLDALPRLADFAKWVVAAEDALPSMKGTFMRVYENNQQETMNDASEGPVAHAVLCLMDNRLIWSGTPTVTLEALENQPGVDYEITTSKSWPRAANKLRGYGRCEIIPQR